MIADKKPCLACKHSSKWAPFYPESFLVCKEPSIVKLLGGPRSCEDIVRKGRHCGDEAKLFKAKA